MHINYNTEQLNHIIKNLFVFTGISINILDTDYNPVAINTEGQKYCLLLQTSEIEKKHCTECDKKILERCRATKKLESHICRAGLYDSAIPIMKYNTIVGFVIMGQVRSENSPVLSQYHPNIDSQSLKQLNQFYKKTPFISKKRLESFYNLLPHILFDSAIEIMYDSFVNEIIDFIDANLHEELNINQLCKKFYVSKNRLYKAFHNSLGNTITGYINEQRIKRAKEFLKQSNEAVYKIGGKVGIDNYTYFCKLFKKIVGVTPTEYRKRSHI